MSKSSCSSMPEIPCEKKNAYVYGYRKQWEIYFLRVLYRCLFCKLGQQGVAWKENLKESFSIGAQQCINFNCYK